MFSLICVWINGWVNNREAGDLRRYRAHNDVTVMDYGIRRLKVVKSIVSFKLITVTSPEDHGVSHNRQLDSSFHSLFMLTTKEGLTALHYGSFVRGIHRWPVDSPHKGTSNAESVSMSWLHHVDRWTQHSIKLKSKQTIVSWIRHCFLFNTLVTSLKQRDWCNAWWHTHADIMSRTLLSLTNFNKSEIIWKLLAFTVVG